MYGSEGCSPGTSLGADAQGMLVTSDIQRRGGSRSSQQAVASRCTAAMFAARPAGSTRQSTCSGPDQETVAVPSTTQATSSRTRRHSRGPSELPRALAQMGVC